jgi:hypothetical protein
MHFRSLLTLASLAMLFLFDSDTQAQPPSDKPNAQTISVGQIVQVHEHGRWIAAEIAELLASGDVAIIYRGWGNNRRGTATMQLNTADHISLGTWVLAHQFQR